MSWLETFGENVKITEYGKFLEVSVYPNWPKMWRMKVSWTLWENGFSEETIKNIISSILWASN